jgi:hypothetical protein
MHRMKVDGWLATVSDLSKSDIFSAAIEVVGVTRRGQGARVGGGGGGTVRLLVRELLFLVEGDRALDARGCR